MFDAKKGEPHKMYFTQVVCEGNMEGAPDSRDLGNRKPQSWHVLAERIDLK